MKESEARTFIGRLREAVRTHMLQEMPADPSGELASKDLAGLLIAYGNWRGRYVEARPRRVHESRELRVSPKYAEHAVALAAVRDEVEAGRDLTPRLSRGVRTAYVPTSERKELKSRHDLDLLLGDWGIHHLHLGTKTMPNGLMERTEDVLLAIFDQDDAYLIDTRGHPRTDNWAEARIMRTVIRSFPGLAHRWEARFVTGLRSSVSDEERLELRQAGGNVPLEVDGKVYVPVPAGLSVAGTPLADARHSNLVMHRLDALERQFVDDPGWLDNYLGSEGRPLPEQPEWRPHVHQDQCGALEEQTGCFVAFVPLRRF